MLLLNRLWSVYPGWRQAALAPFRLVLVDDRQLAEVYSDGERFESLHLSD